MSTHGPVFVNALGADLDGTMLQCDTIPMIEILLLTTGTTMRFSLPQALAMVMPGTVFKDVSMLSP